MVTRCTYLNIPFARVVPPTAKGGVAHICHKHTRGAPFPCKISLAARLYGYGLTLLMPPLQLLQAALPCKLTPDTKVISAPLSRDHPARCSRYVPAPPSTTIWQPLECTPYESMVPTSRNHVSLRISLQPRSVGGHPSPPQASVCSTDIGEEGLIPPSPPSITSLKAWAHMINTHTREIFASLAALYQDHSCM